MGNTKNRARKKRKIPPPRKRSIIQDGEPSYKDPGPSARKISQNTEVLHRLSENIGSTLKEGTIFMDLSILFNVFDNVLKCPDCQCDIEAHVDMKKKCGFSHYIVLQCKNMDCEWKYSFNTSKKQGRSYEVNVRSVLAFREIGKGHTGMTIFNKIMNMPSPPTRRVFTKIQNEKVLPVVKRLATDSMLNNAYKIRDESANDDRECGVSIDGTWQKRGYSSHNGVVTVISLDTKKCLDVEVLSDKCNQCQKWGKRTNDPSYSAWKASHICKINHEGSAGSMETTGAVRIFERSLATRGLKYTNMLGDGDSSTYNSIVESQPYGEDCIPNKLECIGHVQKRVGSRLRKLKSSNKGLTLADGKKGLSGKGRLTDSKIDVLQNYYGLAVRENLDDVGKMAKSIEASLYHVASTDKNPQHHLCPEGEDSWCGYQKDKEGYKHKNGIPDCIVDLIKPIYKDLSKPELLNKCTHGLTQNVNECLNNLIWNRCPKSIYVEQETVALATYLAILRFNDGDISFVKLFQDLDITPGKFTTKASEDCDNSRIEVSAKKSSEKVKKRRKLLRHLRKNYVDGIEEKEGVTYEPGAF
jgi:hypothetical protein